MLDNRLMKSRKISTFIQSEAPQIWVVTSHRYGILRSFLRCHSQENHRWCRDKISKFLNKIVFRKKKKKKCFPRLPMVGSYLHTRITAYFFVNLVDCFSKKKKCFPRLPMVGSYLHTRITAYFFVNLVDCFSMGTTSPSPSPTPTNAN